MATGSTSSQAAVTNQSSASELVADHDDFTQNPETDIAQNEFLDQLKVSAAGRVRFQKIFARTPGGKKTTVQYDAQNDAPPSDQTLSILPTTEEKEGRAQTTQFLVVGLVIAEEPLKYSTKGTGKSRNKDRDTARSTRGVIPAEANMLRAIVPITEYINSGSIKYYIACHPVDGLCNLRTVTADSIFFFSEIWIGISTNAAIKQRRTLLGSACKRHAAASSEPTPERAQTSITNPTDSTLSNELRVTRDVNAANLNALEGMTPDLDNKPSNEGTIAFYNFGSALGKDEAEKLIKELQVCVPTTICVLEATC